MTALVERAHSIIDNMALPEIQQFVIQYERPRQNEANSSARELFRQSLSQFSDDFLADGRPEEVPNERVTL